MYSRHPVLPSLRQPRTPRPDFCAHSEGRGRIIRSHAGSHGRNGDWVHPRRSRQPGRSPSIPNRPGPTTGPTTTSPSNSEVHQCWLSSSCWLSSWPPRSAQRSSPCDVTAAATRRRCGPRRRGRRTASRANRTRRCVSSRASSRRETPGSKEPGVSPCPGRAVRVLLILVLLARVLLIWAGQSGHGCGREHPNRVRVSGAARTGAVHCLGPFSARTRSAREAGTRSWTKHPIRGRGSPPASTKNSKPSAPTWARNGPGAPGLPASALWAARWPPRSRQAPPSAAPGSLKQWRTSSTWPTTQLCGGSCACWR